jgi:cyclohexanecarboxylate-CoA ligase
MSRADVGRSRAGQVDFDRRTSFWNLVERRAELTPNRPMLIDDQGARVTFAEFRDRCARVAAGLVGHGLGLGSSVTWQLPTTIDTAVVSTALARLGCRQNPIIANYRSKEVRFILEQTGADAFLVPGTWNQFDYTAMAEECAASLTKPAMVIDIGREMPDGDPATLPDADNLAATVGDVRWIHYTSGTTSEPKGVMHTDFSQLSGAWAMVLAQEITSDDVGSMAFPIAHISGVIVISALLLAGYPAVLLDRFEAKHALDVFRQHGVTLAGGSPVHYAAFLAVQRQQPETSVAPTVRAMIGGGAPMPATLFHQVEDEIKCAVLHGYGMTEAPEIALVRPSDNADQRAHSVGAPVVDTDIRIVRDDGSLAPTGVDGEVRVSGPQVCVGYVDPVQNAKAFDDVGYFCTGDVGHLRADGHLRLTGRLKEIIIRKAENISPREVEELLAEHPAVGAVAVIGLPDQERGERVCAVLERGAGRPELSLPEVFDYLHGRGLMVQKIPEQLEYVDELPRNAFLKVAKDELKTRFDAKPWP